METHLFDETRQALLGLAPFSLNSTYDFVPEIYKQCKVPEDQWPTFSIRPWTKVESEGAKKAILACAKAYSSEKQEEYVRLEKTMLEFVRKAVVGWSNFIDSGSGEQIQYIADTAGGVDKTLWDRFPDALLIDISNKCNLISGTGPAEKLGLKF